MSLNLRQCGLYSPKVNSPIGKIRLPQWKRKKYSPSKHMVKYWGSRSASPFPQNTWRSAKGRPTLYCLQHTTAGHVLRVSWPGLRRPEDSPAFGSLQKCKCTFKSNLNSTFPEHLFCAHSWDECWVWEDPMPCSSLHSPQTLADHTAHNRCDWCAKLS